jgi:oxygen-dependent protoporphyrinogen oxidase
LLIETLRDQLNGPLICCVKVRRLEKVTNEPFTTHHSSLATHASPLTNWIVHGEGRDCWPADAVVLACPAYDQAVILADIDLELARRVESIAYNKLAVVALGYRQSDVPFSLDGFGFIAPERTRRDILGVQWCSSIFPQRAPAGMVLLRAMCGGWNRPDVVSWDDNRLIQAVRAELRLSMSITAEPAFHSIIRWDKAIPQYRLGHLDQVTWIENRASQYPGLFLAGNAYHGVALNDCVEQADILAERVRSFLDVNKKE